MEEVGFFSTGCSAVLNNTENEGHQITDLAMDGKYEEPDDLNWFDFSLFKKFGDFLLKKLPSNVDEKVLAKNGYLHIKRKKTNCLICGAKLKNSTSYYTDKTITENALCRKYGAYKRDPICVSCVNCWQRLRDPSEEVVRVLKLPAIVISIVLILLSIYFEYWKGNASSGEVSLTSFIISILIVVRHTIKHGFNPFWCFFGILWFPALCGAIHSILSLQLMMILPNAFAMIGVLFLIAPGWIIPLWITLSLITCTLVSNYRNEKEGKPINYQNTVEDIEKAVVIGGVTNYLNKK